MENCHAKDSNRLFLRLPSLKLTRDAQGVLVVECHTKGGPLIFAKRIAATMQFASESQWIVGYVHCAEKPNFG